MDVLPHPGNRICQKFIGFTDNKSLAIFQALCKLSNIILCHRVSWLGHDSGMCWSTLLTSPSKYLKCVFRMQKRDMLFFAGMVCRRLVPYLMPFLFSFFLWNFSYYKISCFHNFKKVNITRTKKLHVSHYIEILTFLIFPNTTTVN